jgi:hypothetical protein
VTVAVTIAMVVVMVPMVVAVPVVVVMAVTLSTCIGVFAVGSIASDARVTTHRAHRNTGFAVTDAVNMVVTISSSRSNSSSRTSSANCSSSYTTTNSSTTNSSRMGGGPHPIIYYYYCCCWAYRSLSRGWHGGGTMGARGASPHGGVAMGRGVRSRALPGKTAEQGLDVGEV